MTTWYLPTLYGDIQLKTKEPKITQVIFEKLSPQEIVAMRTLLERAEKKEWASTSTLRSLTLGSSHPDPQTVDLGASISDVQKVLAKPLKPGRKLVSAVRFTNGKIEEITEQTIGLIEAPAPAEVIEETTGTHRRPTRDKIEKAAKPASAATVAAPAIGCPSPDFERAEIRATRVLEAFLTADQLEDFRTTQSFIALGHETNHRYMIVSRHAPNRQRVSPSHRSLIDLDDNHSLCVHDWLVPAAEEMLALLLCVSVPGAERYVRYLPDDGLDHPELLIGDGEDFMPFLNRIVAPTRRFLNGVLVDVDPRLQEN
jgi:hypothetical protein